MNKIRTDDKIKIIDQICLLHPNYGRTRGWSRYVGGMADTGEWFFRKMLDVSGEELQAALNEWLKEIEESRKRKQATYESDVEALSKYYDAIDEQLLFGPSVELDPMTGRPKKK